MTLPDVYLIGAPKAGTTSIAQWLSEHPDLYFCQPKEPGYWASDYPRVREVRGFDTRAKYEALYADPAASSARHRADGSTTYLYSQAAVPAIAAELGAAARYLVALRNPAELVVSFHRLQQLRLNEDEPDFEKAWQRSLTGRLPDSDLLDPKLVDYPLVGNLGAAVARLLDAVERSQVHFIRFEDLRDHPEQVWRELTGFLGLSETPRPGFDVHNPSTKTFRSPLLHRLRHRPPALLAGPVRQLRHLSLRSQRFKGLKKALWWREQPRPQVSPQMRAALTAYFADDVGLLGRLSGLDLSAWSTTPEALDQDTAERL